MPSDSLSTDPATPASEADQPRAAPGAPKISLVFADGHPIVAEGMRSLLQAEPDLEMLACCTNDDETLGAVRRLQPAVLILDLDLPRKGGLAVLRELAGDRLPTRPVLLTGSIRKDEMTQAIRLGVKGVVLKEMTPRLLIQCIRQVYRGAVWIEKASVGGILEGLLQREAGLHALRRMLTPRELQVLQLVASGMRNKDITAKLHITEGTVKIHLHNIYGKLGIRDRLQLALCARSHGLV